MRDLTEGSILRHLLSMTLFLMGSMVFQSLYFLADMYWIGRLGRDAIAAIGLAANVMLIVLASSQALGVGTTALVSRAIGEGDRDRTNRVFNQTLSLSIVCGAAFFAIGLILYRPYVRWLAADELTRSYGEQYLRWFVPSLALQFPLISTGAALRGSGVVKPTVIILVTSVLLNLVLAPVLILGWGTGRALGVFGAAMATLVAIVIGTLMLAAYMAFIHQYLRVQIRTWGPSLATWKEVVAIGLPSAAELGILAIYLLIVYSLLRPFGAAAQGGFAMGARIGQSLILPAVAVAMANAPIVGQNYGARNLSRIGTAFKTAVIVGVLFMMVMMVIVRRFAATIVRAFTPDAAVVEVAVGYLAILALTFVATGLIFAAVSVFQGLGRTVRPFVSSVIRLIAFVVPALALWRGRSSSLDALWAISAASIAVQAVVNLLFVAIEFRALRLKFRMRE
jgi:putative MATE family efflux protein